ncbi:MAG: ribosome maturation factor RimM [Candidatus Palauibacterales bacterium]|nr:ribosome maturation factor RimM [Candidatus Palauibacterales bacterium]MDP2528811.1 ribosome maturation factor RimM [Candidatus Palauibacterales bacterium]
MSASPSRASAGRAAGREIREMAAQPTQRVVVGTVRRAHGLAGELLVALDTDFPDVVFTEGRVLGVEGPGATGLPRTLTLVGARTHRSDGILRFREIQDRTLAERYRGLRLWVERSELVEPSEGEYFLHDLEGMEVRLVDGSPVGRVGRVYEAAGSPYLGVRREEGGELLVPFIGVFVEDVDAEAGVIRIRPPAGLLEL